MLRKISGCLQYCLSLDDKYGKECSLRTQSRKLQDVHNFFGLQGQPKLQYLLVQNSQADKTQLSFHMNTFQHFLGGNRDALVANSNF